MFLSPTLLKCCSPNTKSTMILCNNCIDTGVHSELRGHTLAKRFFQRVLATIAIADATSVPCATFESKVFIVHHLLQ